MTKAAGALFALLLTSIGLTPSANAALVLSYENGPNAGQVYTGQFTIKLQGVAMGSLYNTPAGSASGYGAGGSSGSVGAGVTDLDGISSPASGSYGSEDTWGIAQITGIYANDAFESAVWTPSGKNQQLTVLFYGEQDFFVSSDDGETFNTDGVGLHVDLYLEDTTGAYTPYGVTAGAGGRTAFDQYTNITDGDLVLSTVSTAGFLHAAGIAGGPETEFSSSFNNTSLIGNGETYLSITGGSSAGMYDTDAFSSAFGTNADFKATFTTLPPSGLASQGGWLISINDPIVGNFSPVPEPSTYGLIGACVLLGIVAFRRKMQKGATLAV